MSERPQQSSDTIDIAEVVRTLRRQYRAVLGFVLLGVLGAAAVVLFAPRRFEGRATVLARTASASGTSIAGRITGLGDLLGGMGGLGSLAGGMETELQMLRSRALAGQVVDSLQLQFRVRQPEGIAPGALIASSSLTGAFGPRKYRFERLGSGNYRVDYKGTTYELIPGHSGALDVGTVTLRASGLPPSFALTVYDREDAIARLSKRLEITKSGGDVARIIYRGDDSVSAAAAANVLVTSYLERRRTTDRGINQRRVEYVTTQLDSTAAELAATERALRLYQESSGVLNADVAGQVELEGTVELRRALTEVQVDEGAIKQLLGQADAGRITSRDLAAYPAFLKGSSVSPLVAQLSELEATRLRLLERRTEQDPEVLALDRSVQAIENNIVGMARSYAGAVTRQRIEMQARLDSIERTLLQLPAAAERGGRLQRDVLRLTQILTALQAQLVEARLAAIGEGGEVRQIDVAVAQRKPAFPKPFLTMGIGTAGGLLAGLIAALFLGWFGRWLHDPMEIERVAGVSAQRLEPGAPLLVGSTGAARTILVVPLDDTAPAGLVAEHLVRTARQRTVQATVLDLSGSATASGNGNLAGSAEGPVDITKRIELLEQQNGLVVVQLSSLSSEATVASLRENRPVLLVAAAGPVDRAKLGGALAMLRRLDVPCAGVIIGDGIARARALT